MSLPGERRERERDERELRFVFVFTCFFICLPINLPASFYFFIDLPARLPLFIKVLIFPRCLLIVSSFYSFVDLPLVLMVLCGLRRMNREVHYSLVSFVF